MADLEQPTDLPNCRNRRRRRRDFLEALRQSQTIGPVPLVDVGQRAMEIRAERSLSIRDLARISGLNVNTLSMIENNKASPSVETLQKLSFALEMPIAAFFEDNSSRTKLPTTKPTSVQASLLLTECWKTWEPKCPGVALKHTW